MLVEFFLDEPSLYICWDHVIHELFFFPMKPSHDNGGEIEFWDASPTKSVVHESW